MKALELLRKVFARCALSRRALLDKSSLLERRIGLMKYYTDRQVAHITLEPFLFGLADAIHVVAAMAIIGAIIIEFDDPSRGCYFDIIDEAAWDSAKALYPSLPVPRLFDRMDLHGQARNCWKIDDAFDGVNWILNQLPAAIGYWDSEDDAAGDSHVGLETCYMCDAPATSREHAPPQCLFPELKDVGRDLRRGLITVPSCDARNGAKSKDDEFMRATILMTAAPTSETAKNFFMGRLLA